MKSAAGVLSVATPGTDYQAPFTGAAGGPDTLCLYEAGGGFPACFVPETLTAARTVSLPDAASTTVIPFAASGSSFVTGLNVDGTLQVRQPSSTDLADASNVAKLDATQLLYDKVLVGRDVQLSAAAGTVTAPDSTNTAMGYRFDVSGPLTIPNPTGTPRNGQRLDVCLRSSAPQTVTWGSAYTNRYGLSPPHHDDRQRRLSWTAGGSSICRR